METHPAFARSQLEHYVHFWARYLKKDVKKAKESRGR